ncbi:TPA: hypothetical protein ACJH7G_004248 [Shigella sonnei]
MEAREATATGESCMRVDAIAKVTGRARYTDDYVMAGMYDEVNYLILVKNPGEKWIKRDLMG